MSKAEPVYRLQLLDIDLDSAHKQLRDVEAALTANPAVAHAQAEIAKAHQVHHKLALEVKSLELEGRSLYDKIKADEDRLYKGQIKTPKELVDLQHEIEVLKRNSAVHEEKQFTQMLALEEAAQVMANCQSAVTQATKHWQEDSVGLRNVLAQLKDRISADEERREAISAAIPRAEMMIYLALRTKKAGSVAVAMVKNGACGLCGEEPSSVLLQQARTGSTLATCTGCGRILFPG
jgi:predicted  nucleic acid-binding Zn-ribbon protein